MARLVGLILSDDDELQNAAGGGAARRRRAGQRHRRAAAAADRCTGRLRRRRPRRRCVVGDGHDRARSVAGRAGAASSSSPATPIPDADPASRCAPAPTSSSPGRRRDETVHEGDPRTAARRDRAGRSAGGDDARVLRRQGRRRHDHARGELRRRARAPHQAARRSSSTSSPARRGGAVPRRAQPLHAARRARQPAPARRRVPARAGRQAQVGPGHPGRFRPRSTGPAPATPPASKRCSACSSKTYDYIVIDAGSQINSCAVAALYTADTICLVANPDVPSRAQRAAAARARPPAGTGRANVCACC